MRTIINPEAASTVANAVTERPRGRAHENRALPLNALKGCRCTFSRCAQPGSGSRIRSRYRFAEPLVSRIAWKSHVFEYVHQRTAVGSEMPRTWPASFRPKPPK